MLARPSLLFLLLLFGITQCTFKGSDLKKRVTKKEFDHFFSNTLTQDHFILELEGEEVLLGKTHLRIMDSNKKEIYNYTWEVSNYFWKVENHYLDQEGQIDLFWNIFDHYFDEKNFSLISEMKVTGSIKSSDTLFIRDIVSDSSSIGLSLLVQDYCISFSKKHQKAILLRAIRKDVLKKYNIDQ